MSKGLIISSGVWCCWKEVTANPIPVLVIDCSPEALWHFSTLLTSLYSVSSVDFHCLICVVPSHDQHLESFCFCFHTIFHDCFRISLPLSFLPSPSSFFWERIFLCTPGCSGTRSVDQAGLKLRSSFLQLPKCWDKGMCPNTHTYFHLLPDTYPVEIIISPSVLYAEGFQLLFIFLFWYHFFIFPQADFLLYLRLFGCLLCTQD